ncbi:MAG: hypothetical protein M3Y22_18815 [Pseudomonadota bacterium]|nr:hypothetical protein [Pseudomonadota bacterium]
MQITADIDALDLLAGNTTFHAINGTNGGVNAGTIIVQDATFVVPVLNTLLGGSATLEIGGVFNNTGLISLNGQPHLLGLLDTDQETVLKAVGATTLTGGGHVTLSDVPLNIIDGTAGAVLTNVNNTISGSGFIEHVGFVNEAAGIVDANQSRDLILAQSATATNRGLMEGTGRAALVIACTVDNTSGGVIEADGGRVGLESATIIGGTLETVNRGIIIANIQGSVLDGRTEAVKIEGGLIVAHGSNLTIEGAIDNTGKFVVSATTLYPQITDLIIGSSGATLSGGGELILTPHVENRVFGVDSAATLTNVDNRISGAGLLGNGVLTLDNETAGIIVGNSAVGLTINTGGNVIQNAGLIYASHGALVTIDSAVNNTGRLESQSGSLVVDGAVTGSGEGVVNGGTIDFASTFSENLVFGGSGEVVLAHSQSYGGTVYGFSKTKTTSLDLRDIGFGGSTRATYSGAASGGTLTVTDGTHTAHIAFKGDYLGSTFTVSNDGHGGTIVKDPTTASSAASAHRFVAAAAGLVARGAGSVALAQGSWQAHSLMLAKPAVMTA